MNKKLLSRIREVFSRDLDADFKKKWRRNLTTEYNILAMRMVSRPSNGKPMTKPQQAWIDGWVTGRQCVLDKIIEATRP